MQWDLRHAYVGPEGTGERGLQALEQPPVVLNSSLESFTAAFKPRLGLGHADLYAGHDHVQRREMPC